MPPDVRKLNVANGLLQAAVGYVMVFVTAYLPEAGVRPDAVGLVLGALGVAMVASSVPLGLAADRWGRRGVLLSAAAVLPVSFLALAFTTAVPYLVAAAVVGGVCEGATSASWNAIIADRTRPSNRDAAFAHSFVYSSVGLGAGFALPIAFPPAEAALGIDTHAVHRGAMVGAALLTALAGALMWRVLRSDPETPRASRPSWRTLPWRPLLKFSAVNSLIGLGAGLFIPLVPTWLYLKFGVPDDLSGPLIALANLSIGLSTVASASVARRLGSVRAIVTLQGLSTVFMLSLVFLPSVPLVAAAYLVRTALMNMALPLLESFLMGIIAPEQRGLASAVNGISWRLPNSVTTVVGGLLLASGLYDLPVFLACGLYVTGITAFWVLFRKASAAA